jgi:hypothetical protein
VALGEVRRRLIGVIAFLHSLRITCGLVIPEG